MYISISVLKAYLGISATGDDTLLSTLAAAAQRIVEQHTRRVFEYGTATAKAHDAVADTDSRRRTLFLCDDLCSITSVVNGDGETVTAAQYVTEPRHETPYYALTLLSSANVTWTYVTDPEGAIVVTGKWAYAVTVPADIVQATTRLAAYLYRQKDNAADLDRAIVAGNATILPATLPADVVRLLEPYRRLVG